MAFLVETGEGVEGANSLVSLDEAIALCEDRRADDRYAAFFDCDPDLQKSWLILATEFIDGKYGGCFRGLPRFLDHLPFPRNNLVLEEGGVLANNIVPTRVKLAVVEVAAIKAGGHDIEPVLSYDPEAPGALAESISELGELKEKTRFSIASTSKIEQIRGAIWMPRIERLLAPYLYSDDLLERA